MVVGSLRSILWMSDALSQTLHPLLPLETMRVSSAREFLDARPDSKTVLFVDGSTITDLDRAMPQTRDQRDKMAPLGPTIAICDEQLRAAVGWLSSRPWLSHVVGAPMLQHPMMREHLRNLIATLTK